MEGNLSTAIMLAGGEGTRLRPLTYDIPKPLVKVNGKPLLEYAIEELERNGIKHIVVSTGYKADKVIDYLTARTNKRSECKIDYIIEEKLLRTGGAIRYAMNAIKNAEDFAVVYADTIFKVDMQGMYRLHRSQHSMATIGIANVEDVSGFGVVNVEGDKISSFVEKPDPSKCASHVINAGIYLLSSGISNFFPQKDAFSLESEVFQTGLGKIAMFAYKLDEFITINTLEQLNAAEKALNSRKIKH